MVQRLELASGIGQQLVKAIDTERVKVIIAIADIFLQIHNILIR
jgi:hypothetical protein